MTKKILWVTVNYKTETYLSWKLKMAYEFEDSNLFDFMIVDNSPVHDKEFFDKLKEQYPDVIVKPHIPVNVNRTSGEHGQGLDIALQYAREKGHEYYLANDPDFFWTQRNILNYFLAEFKNENYVGIGAPYTIPLRNFDYNTPCLFGCIYSMEFLKDLSLSPHKDQHQTMIEGKDVGWEIRQKLAQTGAKHLTFTQSDVQINDRVPGQYSYEAILRQYHLYGRRIATHLHRGSFDAPLGKFMENNWRSDRTKDLNKPPMDWTQTREAYCQKYYEELKNSKGYL